MIKTAIILAGYLLGSASMALAVYLADKDHENKQRNYNNSGVRLIVDWPEEKPIPGDVLIVEAQRGDTLILGYHQNQ